MPPHLEFDRVELSAQNQHLLGPVTLRLDSPGMTVVMGPNGAGKSLFLSAAHGLIPLTKGRVTWDGTAAVDSRASRGFVFQTTPVLRRSISGNIAFALKARGVARMQRAALVAAALSLQHRRQTDGGIAAEGQLHGHNSPQPHQKH